MTYAKRKGKDQPHEDQLQMATEFLIEASINHWTPDKTEFEVLKRTDAVDGKYQKVGEFVSQVTWDGKEEMFVLPDDFEKLWTYTDYKVVIYKRSES